MNANKKYVQRRTYNDLLDIGKDTENLTGDKKTFYMKKWKINYTDEFRKK